MSIDADPRDPVTDGVELSVRRLRAWPQWQRHLYAGLVALAWLGLTVALIVVAAIVARDGVSSTVTAVLLIWLGIFVLVVMTWLLWQMAIPLYADLATGGRFSPWRAAHLRRFDRIFSRTALAVLLSIVVLPALQLFE